MTRQRFQVQDADRPSARPRAFAVCLVLLALASGVHGAQIDIVGPAGSGAFGTGVVVLPNGNIVVTDPSASVPAANAGAVHLYSPLGVLISTLTGSSANNQIGSGGITVLSNGNYVIRSPNWDAVGFANVGAVTWANAATGRAGMVSATNSLVGSTASDRVGNQGVTALTNGHYVVATRDWDNGSSVDVGAVTWGNGSAGLVGLVSSGNSLIGTAQTDQVGEGGVAALSNGNYVFASPDWNNGPAADVGAVTWALGTAVSSGPVATTNSLFGATAGDLVGAFVTALSNGHYVVASPSWNNVAVADVGAATWGSGIAATAGAISSTLSLIGSTSGDRVGDVVVALSNGHYVVASSLWNNGAVLDVGAVTWANGTSGRSGNVLPQNSLIGTTPDDRVGNFGVTALTNGHYVVASSMWDNGATVDAGAATWASGTAGLTGVVSTGNSLIGTTFNDGVPGKGVTALSNGNYVVTSAFWSNGGTSAVGAVTWANGTASLASSVSTTNSLIGRRTNDFVGSGGVKALTNGNFVVISPFWDSSPSVEDGAATWVNGSTGLVGMVTPGNSLFGSRFNDFVGTGGVTALSNGNYVVSTPTWNNGTTADVGAATWAVGTAASAGAVTAANSLTGAVMEDFVSSGGITALGNGHYAVASPAWDNGGIPEAGAVTLGRGDSALTGPITASNSVRGTVTGGGANMPFGFDTARSQLAVGRPASNIVSLLTLSTPLPEIIFANGFE